MEVFMRNRQRGAKFGFTFTPDDTSVSTPYIYEETGAAWRLKLLTSGTLTFKTDTQADVFLVGGGGGGGATASFTGGGGGGRTATVTGASFAKRTGIGVTIGAGGVADQDGGTSSVSVGITTIGSAAGGGHGLSRAGGAGGSGGGGGSYGGSRAGGAGGSDGSAGAKGAGSSPGSGGAGQGTTTRAFGESTGDLYAGGGGGGSANTSGYSGQALGGDGGGGNGNAGSSGGAEDGAANTGGGGGGSAAGMATGSGGSGIVILRGTKPVDYTQFTDVSTFKTALASLVNGNVGNITAFLPSTTAPESGVTTVNIAASGMTPILCWANSTVVYWHSAKQKVYLPEDATYMFSWTRDYFFNTGDVETIDLTGIRTSKTKLMGGMFGYNRNLRTLNLSEFDTSNVIDYSGMFYSCTSLETLDISAFTRSSDNYISASTMFNTCTSLTTIYANADFHLTDNASQQMFLGCTLLRGGYGTPYSDSHTDGEYARVDSLYDPGYFTDVSQAP